MIARPVRRFTLIDAMILVAAAAVGFAGVRAEGDNHYHHRSTFLVQDRNQPEFARLFNGYLGRPPWSIKVFQWSRTTLKVAPVAAVLSLALVVIRCRRPRPPCRRLVRQPGLVAGLAVAAALGLNALLASGQILLAAIGQSGMTDPKFYANLGFLTCQTLYPGMIGMAVLAAWLVLKVSGRWRRESGWVDPAGIALGSVWVGLLLTEWAVERLQ